MLYTADSLPNSNSESNRNSYALYLTELGCKLERGTVQYLLLSQCS